MNAKEKYVRIKPIPSEKTELVEELAGNMKKFKTVLIASMKGLPGGQFNQIKKNFRGKAEVKVAKKSVTFRAIDATEKGALQELKKSIGADFVLFFSDIEAFELSGLLSDSVSPARAKAGDLAPYDLEIEAGMTELLPGPAISELGGVGLKVKVTDGKLEIIKGAVIVKEGEAIKENVASVLGKLGIEPMKVGFTPVAAYSAEEDKVYVNIKIDKEETLDELKDLIKKALGFAVNMDYPCDKTVAYFIMKAGVEEMALEKLMDVKPVEEKKEEAEEVKETKEESKEESTEEKKEEEKPAEEKVEETKEEVKEDNAEDKQEDKKDE